MNDITKKTFQMYFCRSQKQQQWYFNFRNNSRITLLIHVNKTKISFDIQAPKCSINKLQPDLVLRKHIGNTCWKNIKSLRGFCPLFGLSQKWSSPDIQCVQILMKLSFSMCKTYAGTHGLHWPSWFATQAPYPPLCDTLRNLIIPIVTLVMP